MIKTECLVSSVHAVAALSLLNFKLLQRNNCSLNTSDLGQLSIDNCAVHKYLFIIFSLIINQLKYYHKLL